MLAVVEVADDGAADGLPGRGAERLHDARDDQARRCSAAKIAAVLATVAIASPASSDRPAAEAVGQRPEHELRHREPQDDRARW